MDLGLWKFRPMVEVDIGSLVLSEGGVLLIGKHPTSDEYRRALRLSGPQACSFVYVRGSDSCMHYQGQFTLEADPEELINWPEHSVPWSHAGQLLIGEGQTLVTGLVRREIECMTVAGVPVDMQHAPRFYRSIRHWRVVVEDGDERVTLVKVDAQPEPE